MLESRFRRLAAALVGGGLYLCAGCGDREERRVTVIEREPEPVRREPREIVVVNPSERREREVVVEQDRPRTVVHERREVIVCHSEPPRIRVERPGRSPGRDYIWIAGYWKPRGKDFAWVAGRYEKSRGKDRHVAAEYVKTRDGWEFRGETWNR